MSSNQKSVGEDSSRECVIDQKMFPMPQAVWDVVAKEMALSPRHRQIVERLLHDRQTKQIALDLGSPESTIETHLKRLYRYHGTSGRNGLLLLVFRLAMQAKPVN